MTNIVKIEKSWEKVGYAFITTENGKSYLRKVYDNQLGIGRPSINLGSDIYSFYWDGNDAKDIKWELNYSKDGKPSTPPQIKKIKDAKKVETKVQKIIEDIKEDIKPEIKLPEGEIRHEQYEKIKTCIENNIPVYLVGPAGSGKNYTLEQIAKDLGLEFYFTNSVQQEYKITGFIDAGGKYHETEFYKAFTNGGLFFLDEMDASIPEVLVLLNAAIANGYFEFPNGKITANENFRIVAAGNTVGDGADEQYTGRLVLDQATLDRFAVIDFDYDMNVELHIAKGDNDLVKFVRDLRKQANDKGVRATFSYRAISMVTKLNGKLQVEEILQIAVFKGMDKDTINTFKPLFGNKYGEALNKMQFA